MNVFDRMLNGYDRDDTQPTEVQFGLIDRRSIRVKNARRQRHARANMYALGDFMDSLRGPICLRDRKAIELKSSVCVHIPTRFVYVVRASERVRCAMKTYTRKSNVLWIPISVLNVDIGWAYYGRESCQLGVCSESSANMVNYF